jgi:hypothetical protein
MPVVGEAGNRITWNHFHFVASGDKHRQEPSMRKTEVRIQESE